MENYRTMTESGRVLDDSTIRLAAAGSRDALREIYELFGARIHRTIQRIVGLCDADDVLQETMIRLVKSLPTFRFESAFATWFHRLAVNEALQHLRKQQRRDRLAIDWQPEHLGVEAAIPVAREDQELLERALQRLDPGLRRVFELKVIDELSYTEIGEVLDIPAGTVGSRLTRARQELRTQLLSWGWERT
jgi:RNA polymerase sigma-70 factor (ECF subfamily)